MPALLARAGLLDAGQLGGLLAGSDELGAGVELVRSRPTEPTRTCTRALERGLVEVVGAELGGRLRAGRSRNDQIATLFRCICATMPARSRRW